MAKVSIVMAVWNTSHLLWRTLDTLMRQSYKDFEVIVVDDNSEDDVEAAVAPYRDKLDIKVHRLVHNFGMRGNTVSFNVGFSLASGQMILENTPEIMFYDNTVEDMVEALGKFGPRSWVSIRTYNITPEDQIVIDTVDWKNDIHSLETLLNFHSDWTQNNTKQEFFGTHQTCIFYRDDWFKYWRRYPSFLDYGTDDPWNAGVRQRMEIQSATIKPFVFHQWHAPIAFWMTQGKAPYWNMWGHTLKNYFNDPRIPAGGTAEMWDRDKPQGQNYQMNKEEAEGWAVWKDKVKASGFRRKDGEDW